MVPARTICHPKHLFLRVYIYICMIVSSPTVCWNVICSTEEHEMGHNFSFMAFKSIFGCFLLACRDCFKSPAERMFCMPFFLRHLTVFLFIGKRMFIIALRQLNFPFRCNCFVFDSFNYLSLLSHTLLSLSHLITCSDSFLSFAGE